MTQNKHLRLAHALNFTEDGGVPEWIMLVPAGDKINGRDGRWFANTQPDLVIERFVNDGGELVIDYEHATEIWPEDANPAAGWIKALEKRSGAIWGQVDWTDRASSMISQKEYRFISPVCGTTQLLMWLLRFHRQHSLTSQTLKCQHSTSVAQNIPKLKLKTLHKWRLP